MPVITSCRQSGRGSTWLRELAVRISCGTCTYLRQGGGGSNRVAQMTFRTPLWDIPLFGIGVLDKAL
jgi:hypothetical protein